ncbi:MAG: hypothetical protein F4X11_08300 [Acidobacteria bacterium]|nr:hypothetical protein [Acidobacteriota bacterium]
MLGLAATVVPTAAVIVTALIQNRANRDAHSGIVARLEGVEARAEKRADALATTLDAQRRALEAIARDLSFLAGRQAERDRNPDAGSVGGVR